MQCHLFSVHLCLFGNTKTLEPVCGGIAQIHAGKLGNSRMRYYGRRVVRRAHSSSWLVKELIGTENTSYNGRPNIV